MYRKIQLVNIQTLVAHERTDRVRLAVVRSQINACSMVKRPVIVDKDSGVILDGHHRVKVLKELGAVRVPAIYVRYRSEEVEVYLRRKEILMDLLKQYVVERATSHHLFQSKTTRHIIRKGRGSCRIRVVDLMR